MVLMMNKNDKEDIYTINLMICEAVSFTSLFPQSHEHVGLGKLFYVIAFSLRIVKLRSVNTKRKVLVLLIIRS